MKGEVFSYETPLGWIAYTWDGDVCHEVSLLYGPSGAPPGNDPVRAWLDAWVAGEEHPLPPLTSPRTPFQSVMRDALLAIPRGEVRSYGELAGQLHTAPRALGQALGANPLPVIIPCHRVVAAHGLGGFSCGLEWKRRLLAFERQG